MKQMHMISGRHHSFRISHKVAFPAMVVLLAALIVMSAYIVGTLKPSNALAYAILLVFTLLWPVVVVAVCLVFRRVVAADATIMASVVAVSLGSFALLVDTIFINRDAQGGIVIFLLPFVQVFFHAVLYGLFKAGQNLWVFFRKNQDGGK